MKTRILRPALTAGVLAAAFGLAAVPAAASAATANQWRISYRTSAVGGMYGVAAINRSDAWAVGVLYNGQAPVNRVYALHWNGSKWSTATIPGGDGYISNAVAASSASNVWVFGVDARDSLNEKTFRFDGAHWRSIAVPYGNTDLNSPVVLSPTNVWALGSTSCTTASGGTLKCTSDVWHWNGSGWRSYPIGTDASTLSGTSAAGVWVIGVNGQTQSFGAGSTAAYRWAGDRWVPVRMSHPRLSDSLSIAVDSASDVWIGALTAGGGRGYAMHWNGRTWRALTAPADLPAGSEAVPDGHGGVWLGPWAHWTGRMWVNTLQSGLPAPASGMSVEQLVKVPGTAGSYWGAGWVVIGEKSTVNRPAVLVYGPQP